MQTLSEKLKTPLAKRGITSAYYHTGVEPDETAANEKEILQKDSCDAILVFEQTDESGNPISVKQDIGLSIFVGGVIMSRTTTFRQAFLITLRGTGAGNPVYWKAALKVNIDPTKSKYYAELRDMIIENMGNAKCFPVAKNK